LEVNDSEEDSVDAQDNDLQPTDQPLLISLHVITGVPKNDTMRVHVTISRFELTAFLDLGSTTNFISKEAAQQVGLYFNDSTGANVIVANGDRVAYRGLARNVSTRIGDEFFEIDCYAIPLDCYDMVLGTSFLRMLGPIL